MGGPEKVLKVMMADILQIWQQNKNHQIQEADH